MTAHLEPVVIQKINRALVQITAENLAAFVPADFSRGGNLVEVDGFAVVVVNIGNHIALHEKVWLLRFCGRFVWHHRMAAQKTAP